MIKMTNSVNSKRLWKFIIINSTVMSSEREKENILFIIFSWNEVVIDQDIK